MANKSLTSFAIFSLLFFWESGGPRIAAQDDPTHLRVNVVLVQLSVAVTDSKGNKSLVTVTIRFVNIRPAI